VSLVNYGENNRCLYFCTRGGGCGQQEMAATSLVPNKFLCVFTHAFREGEMREIDERYVRKVIQWIKCWSQ
jgi:hypothetical protein